MLDRGVAPIMPTRPGVVTAVTARETQRVEPGAPLVEIRAEEMLAAGSTAAQRILDSMSRQDADLGRQGAEAMAAAAADRSRLEAQITGLTQEMASLDQQIGVQRRVRRRRLEGGRPDPRVRRARLYQPARRPPARSNAVGAPPAARAIAASAHREGRLLAEARGRSRRSGAAAPRLAEPPRRAAPSSPSAASTPRRRRATGSTAPVDGTVTAVTARPGQPAMPQQPLMVVMPADARPSGRALRSDPARRAFSRRARKCALRSTPSPISASAR